MFYISYLGILIALLLFLYRNKDLGDNYTLALFYLTNSIFGIVHNTMYSSENPTIIAILTVHFTPFYFLVGPSMYFFVKRTYLTPFREKFDVLHLALPLLILINIVPYIFTPFEEKLTLADNIIHSVTNQYNYHFVLLPGIFQSTLRPFVNIIYSVASFIIWWKYHNKKILKKDSMNNMFKWWTFGFMLIFLLANLASFFLVSNLYIREKTGLDIFLYIPLNLVQNTVVTSFFFQNLIILFIPFILFSKHFKSEFIVDKPLDIIQQKAEKQDLQNADLGILNEEKIKEITEAINKITKKDDYLANDFSLSKLALEANLPYHVLTNYFSKYLKVSFPEWKNRHRIEFVKNKLKDGAANSLTLESIGEMAGFNSRGAFIKVFKKYTGFTPSEYLKSL